MASWFRRHGALAIVVGRLVPGLRTPTTIMAGLFGVPYWTFAPAPAVGALLWAAAYYLAGALLQRHWQEVMNGLVGDVDAPVAIVVGLVRWRRGQAPVQRAVGARAKPALEPTVFKGRTPRTAPTPARGSQRGGRATPRR